MPPYSRLKSRACGGISVNNSLCDICSYDYRSFYGKYNTDSGNHPDAGTAYGCLVRHKAVCEGYAEAFRLIMDRLKIPNKLASSKDHTWNKVKLGGKWYHVDVTWNDGTNRSKYLLTKKHRK